MRYKYYDLMKQQLSHKSVIKSFFILVSLFATFFAISGSALADPPADPYADLVDPTTSGVLNATDALSAPDDNRATILGIGNNLVLDMGANEEGTGDLTVYYGGLALGVIVPVDFLDETYNLIESHSLTLNTCLGSCTVTLAYSQKPNPYRFLRFRGVINAYTIDAVETATYRPDSDGDTIPDVQEDLNTDGDLTNDNTDGDSLPNALDADDDGDSILTKNEDINNDTDLTNDDSDSDTTPNYLDPDDDGDTVLTISEDADNNGSPLNDDTDSDTVPNYLDPDDDGDTVPTISEDADNNGSPLNDDSDSDTVPNYLDPDDDGDNVPTISEDADGNGSPLNDDSDSDTVPNYLDPDDDGDDVMTKVECPTTCLDTDGDTVADFLEPNNVDTDNDGKMDNVDNDDDGDNVLTIDEDKNGDGNPINDDTDTDGIPDYLDAQATGSGSNTTIYLPFIITN